MQSLSTHYFCKNNMNKDSCPETIVHELKRGQFYQLHINEKIEKLLIYKSGKIAAVSSSGTSVINNIEGFKRELFGQTKILKDHYLTVIQSSDKGLKLVCKVRGVGGGNTHSSSGVQLTKEELERIKPYKNSSKGNKDKALNEAIFAKDATAVKILLKFGADPNSIGHKASNFVNAFTFFSDYKDLELFEEMLKRGANPNVNFDDDEPLFFHVVDSSRGAKLAKLLLQWNANPNVVCIEEGRSALHACVNQLGDEAVIDNTDWEEVCALMLKKGVSPNATHPYCGSLLNSVMRVQKNKKVAELFIQHGFNFKDPSLISSKDGPLGAALGHDWEDLFMLMLEKGADPNEKDSVYTNVLHQAIAKSKQYTEALIRAGADVNTSQPYKEANKEWTRYPINSVIERGWNDLLELMLENGANLNIEDAWGFPICYALVYGDLETVQLLINKTVDLNKQDSQGRTPISYFIEDSEIKLYNADNNNTFSNLKEKLKLMISSGANIDGPCHDNMTPLSYFLKHHQIKKDWSKKVNEELLMLLELGADPQKIPLEFFSILSFDMQDLLLENMKVGFSVLMENTESILNNIMLSIGKSQKDLLNKAKKTEEVRQLIAEELRLSNLVKLFFDKNSPQIIAMKKSFVQSLTEIMNNIIEDSSYVDADKAVLAKEKIKAVMKDTIQTWRATRQEQKI